MGSIPNADPQTFESSPAWSPDGKQIAFSSTRGGGETSLYVMNADGSKVERLEAGGDAQSPAWSPDDKEIAYAAAFEGFFEIHVLTLKTGKVRRLTEGMHAISPAWPPDGKQIAFIAYVHGSPEVYVMNDKGKRLQRLTTDSAADADPVWSPDGTRVLFTSDRGGVPWLYTVRTDGTALTRLPLPSRITGAHQGDWSRDGRIIFSLWGQAPATPAKMSAEAPAPATLAYSPTPTTPPVSVMAAPEAVTGYDRTLTYEYDSLYRLTGATYTEGASVSEYAYGYDLRGNRTSVTAPGVGTFSYTYNLANQITNGGFSYDLNGNLKTDGTLTYQYDAANRLHKVSRGAETLEYFYNGSGDRYAHTLNMGEAHTSVNYLLDPSGSLSRVLQETMDTPGDDWVNTYLYGLGVLGQQNGSTWSTFGTDPLGSVRFLLDSSGDPTSRADYDPYGVPLPVPGQESGMPSALGFTGEQTDPLGLVNLRARTYNPRLGTFTSVDPGVGVGGSTGWTGYVYANDNPANLVDPAGTCVDPLSFIVCAVVGGAIIGGTTAAAYDVFVNQGFGGENLFRRNLSEVDWGRAGKVGVIGAGIGATVGFSGGLLAPLAPAIFTGASIGFISETTDQIFNKQELSPWKILGASIFGGLTGGLLSNAFKASKLVNILDPLQATSKLGAGTLWTGLAGTAGSVLAGAASQQRWSPYDLFSSFYFGALTGYWSIKIGALFESTLKSTALPLVERLSIRSFQGISYATIGYSTSFAQSALGQLSSGHFSPERIHFASVGGGLSNLFSLVPHSVRYLVATFGWGFFGSEITHQVISPILQYINQGR